MIVPMRKVMVVGPRRLLPEVVAFVHERAVLELRSLTEHRRDPSLSLVRAIRVQPADRLIETQLEERAAALSDLLLLLPAALPAAAPGTLPNPDSADFPKALATLQDEVRAANEKRVRLREERDLMARYERLLTAIAPILPASSATPHLESFGLLVRRDRPESLKLLQQELAGITDGAYTTASREIDREQLAVLVTVPRRFAQAASQLLFERGIGEVKLPERYAGQSFLASLALLVRRKVALPEEMEAAQRELKALAARWREPLARALHAATNLLQELRAVGYCGETGHTFVISGWLPTARHDQLAQEIKTAFASKVSLLASAPQAHEYNDVPVILHNHPLLRPFELLLDLVPLPLYGSIDPTPLIAVSFPLFFGIMVGDVGYGLVALLIALLARARGWGGERGKSIAFVAIVASSSAILFGFLFGELFGEVGRLVGMTPLLIDRSTAALTMLGVVLMIGTAHMLLALALAALRAIRRRDLRAAIGKLATLGLVVAAAVALGAGTGRLSLPIIWPLAAVASLLALALAAEGALAPLELVRLFGNILSYARLMALGVASVMLAQVACRMPELLSPRVVGIAAAVLLHGVNFALALFSPTLHALRLHYVEFFDKFYESGGRSFRPFRLAP